jgi:penicillin-binding protein 1A
MKPTDTMVDEPVEIEGWRPRNSTRTHPGPCHPARGLRPLDQHISAKIGAELGFSTIADMARRFGITGPSRPIRRWCWARATSG